MIKGKTIIQATKASKDYTVTIECTGVGFVQLCLASHQGDKALLLDAACMRKMILSMSDHMSIRNVIFIHRLLSKRIAKRLDGDGDGEDLDGE